MYAKVVHNRQMMIPDSYNGFVYLTIVWFFFRKNLLKHFYPLVPLYCHDSFNYTKTKNSNNKNEQKNFERGSFYNNTIQNKKKKVKIETIQYCYDTTAIRL